MNVHTIFGMASLRVRSVFRAARFHGLIHVVKKTVEGYTVAGINQLPLLPGILVALAFLLAVGSAW